jgi:nickel-dependent lactate racemase
MNKNESPYSLEKTGDSFRYADRVENISITISNQMSPVMVQINEPETVLSEQDVLDLYRQDDKVKIFRENVRGKKNVVIIISDQTRNVPSQILLPHIIDDIRNAGVSYTNIKIIVALGVHRPLKNEELSTLVGLDIFEKVTVINHEAMNPDKLIFKGDSSIETPIYLNKDVDQADYLITIGKVEPHEFAGFTGGRKSILPGVAGEKTIEVNHRPEMILDKYSVPGSLDNNKVHKDMVEAAAFAKVDFCISFVLNKNNQILGVFTGDVLESHKQAVELYRSFAEALITFSPDIVLTTPGEPLNVDFYQTIKPFITLEQIVEKGKVIILYASCPEGVNSVDLVRPFDTSRNIDDVVAFIKDNYKIQMDHALYLARILKKGAHIITVCPTIDNEILEKLQLIPAESVEAAMEMAKEILKSEVPKLLIYPQPQRSIPVIS